MRIQAALLLSLLLGMPALADVDFDRDVAPLLARHCLSCHRGADAEAKLDLSRQASAIQGGEHGPAWVAGDLSASLLWRRVAADEMPEDKPLPEAEKSVLRRWIESGAKWGADIDPFRVTTDSRAGYDWWSLAPLASPASNKLPSTSTKGWARNPIDAFILARLEAEQLTPSAPAEPHQLARRVYYDLAGLPPPPHVIASFTADVADYERLVDQLLASPHFGQRWARHWLDVVRFGESHGFEYNQPRDNAWPYRNWVIDALNSDLPYDEFVRWQIAGDVLAQDSPGAMAAVGFLVAGPHNTTKPSSEKMQLTMRHDELEDIVGTIGQTFLGLTVNCARCHDHKFDPITQREYYQLVATVVGIDHGERKVADDKSIYTAISGRPPDVHLLLRGDVGAAAESVPPAGLRAVNPGSADFGLDETSSDGQRREKLADWLTHGQNAVFARVIVNRLWHYHFGQGLVRTPSDFGFNGDRPSHPELLDYLAGELVRHDWHLKPIHRLILTSATYRQSSRLRAEPRQRDASNRLLWRMNPRRVSAEELRDSILQVAGLLDDRQGGAGYRDVKEYKYRGSHYYDPVQAAGPDAMRRTIYRFSPRGAKRTILDTFDCPDPSAKAPSRAMTVTPLQALALMNNALVLDVADSCARRLRRQAPDVEGQIAVLYQLLYCRAADDEELALAKQFVEANDLPALCRVMFNSNEFLHVR